MVGAGLATYWNSLSGPLIFDDQLSILDNPRIRQWWRLSTVLTPEPSSPMAGRPLVNLSFALNYAAGGLAVGGYHLVNLVVHILCALLFFGIVRRTLMLPSLRHRFGATSTFLAFACAVVWLLHPLNSEVVNYLTQRTESMMALFYLLTLYAAIRAAAPDRHWWWPWLAVFSCGLGMACKESMVTAPLIVLLYDRVFLFDSMQETLKARWRLYVGLATTWLVLIGLMMSNPRGAAAGFSAPVGSWTYLLNQPVMITAYLKRAVWPRSLVAFYGWPLRLTLSDVAPQAALVGSLLVVTLVALAMRPMAGFLGAWFFITLSPASSVVPIALEVGAERRMYLPLMGIVVLAVVVSHAWGTAIVRRMWPADASAPSRVVTRGRAIALASIMIALAAATVDRNREYSSQLTLARTIVDRWPTGANRSILGGILAAAGFHEEAEAHLRLAVADAPRARYDLGAVLFERERFDESLEQLNTFVQIATAPPADHPPWQSPTRGDLVLARTLVGQIYAQRNDWSRAIEEFEAVLKINAHHRDARRFVAQALTAAKRFEDAIVHYREYLKVAPTDGDALTGLGVALASTGQAEDAIAAFRRAVDLNPDRVEAQVNLALALLQHGDVAEAVDRLRQTIARHPAAVSAHDLLGQVLESQGRR